MHAYYAERRTRNGEHILQEWPIINGIGISSARCKIRQRSWNREMRLWVSWFRHFFYDRFPPSFRKIEVRAVTLFLRLECPINPFPFVTCTFKCSGEEMNQFRETRDSGRGELSKIRAWHLEWQNYSSSWKRARCQKGIHIWRGVMAPQHKCS